MKNKSILAFVLLIVYQANSQAQAISSPNPIEPARDHYARLKALDGTPDQSKAWMDAIAYPTSLYRNNTLLFALTAPTYLNEEQVDFLVHAVDYPANSSKQTRAELDFLLELQKKRTEDQISRVLEIAAVGYWPDANHVPTHPNYKKNLDHLFFEVKEVMGKHHKPDAYPATVKLLQGVMGDMRLMEFAVKYHLLRARPYQLETDLKPLRRISSPSFASGHTLWAYCQAYTMAELIPEKRKEFIDLAYEIGFSREIMGVHYPSDEEVARQLAHRMIWLMWHSGSFQDDLESARKEWK